MKEKSSTHYDNQNIFIKIIRNETNACRVYEDDILLAIMDIMPRNPGHVLIIPKSRIRDIFEAPPEILSQIAFLIKKIAIACKSAFQADGIQILQFNGHAAGQTVPHLHFHVIPCKNGDNASHTNIHPTQKIENFAKLEINAQKIRKELQNFLKTT
ncbi:HIT family protein [Candidatus Liberibacter asiaticus]|uniref:Histidine triad (HIT) protein n=2 Tax=Liberibacter asiaticus TaxID=34021 RepID=C6XFV0_LIBAP|nr:HIT family protein [Candidatus Liberibacter asiaticus]ACT57253.1 histidine triad (HIT) protein [Candidatus Liberibacter asiaticus str. psy62]AGH16783.1 histidine triad (HIT) protein [Candidatus Liberibacter asiaticus str. gxpsy]ALK07149.1 HIT domain-containing protein [Candidatus Liberibacter asiaticus]ASK52626.1 HIT family protein [Candidatus Liberibacter asiaticus]AWL13951.1 HIT family protein [Candidatus Liberibacter asiaticus]